MEIFGLIISFVGAFLMVKNDFIKYIKNKNYFEDEAINSMYNRLAHDTREENLKDKYIISILQGKKELFFGTILLSIGFVLQLISKII